MPEDYFSLQLDVVQRYALAAGLPFATAISHCTNLRRRLNLWGPEGADEWNGFLAQVHASTAPRSFALARCMELYETRPRAAPGPSFGCFSYDAPDAAGVLRLHFMPPPQTRESPLASASIAARQNELHAMFTHIRRAERKAAFVRGVSWLYNLDAYKRLFPAAYAASVRPPGFPLHLNGSSTWGQVLNWRQEVKPAVRDEILARLPSLRVETPWAVFPYRALVAECAIGAFYEMLA